MTEEVQTQEQQDQQTPDPVGQPDPNIAASIPNMAFNRKFRRALLKRSGYIKLKNRLGYKDWFENIRNNIQTGNQLHATNTEDVIRRSVEAIEKSDESLANFLLEKGYTEEKAAEIIQKNMEIREKISMKKMKR